MKYAEQPINPTTSWNGCEEVAHFGLTKREHFAGLAMQGILANCNGGMTKGGSAAYSPDAVSELALLHADELLKKLEK